MKIGIKTVTNSIKNDHVTKVILKKRIHDVVECMNQLSIGQSGENRALDCELTVCPAVAKCIETDEPIETEGPEPPMCPSCQEELNIDDVVRLHCYHAFHYDCALGWYKAAQLNYDTVRTCPLCRRDGGFLPIKFGETPIPEIHIPSPKYVNRYSNTTSVSGSVVTAVTNSGCIATIQSKKSPKYGKSCGNTTTVGSYCGVHKSLATGI